MKNITVIGTGYAGLVSGTCFAELDNNVTCVDIDAAKIKRMQQGEVPIYEPGLQDVFTRNVATDRLHFTTSLETAVPGADIIFLALPTPPHEDGSADLSYVLDVAEKLRPLLDGYTVIVTKSTVPVGTGEQVAAILKKVAGGVAVDVVSNPEFLREGVAVQDFMRPDRIVVGSESSRATEVMQELYEPLTAKGSPLIIMDRRSSELTKYAANSFLALKISFMNEIANLCELVGTDVDLIRQGIGSDPRIGSRFLQAGIGYGGSCFPKDAQALLHTSRQHNYDFSLLNSVITLNTQQQRKLTEKALNYYDDITGKVFAVWGLAFKPDTDDIRQAPALGMVDALLQAGATVQAYDPEAMANTKAHFAGRTNLTFATSEYDALTNADALLIATEWPVFKKADLSRVRQTLREPVIFDGRNLYAPRDMEAQGFYYESIGRPVIRPSKS